MRVEVDRSGRLGQVADWNISICIIVMTGSVGLRLLQQVPGWPGASQQSCYRSAAPSARQSPSLPTSLSPQLLQSRQNPEAAAVCSRSSVNSA